MSRDPLSMDTSPEVERILIERWRAMTPAEKLALVSGISQAASSLALAGIRERYPTASPREHFLRFALLHLAQDVAGAAVAADRRGRRHATAWTA